MKKLTEGNQCLFEFQAQWIYQCDDSYDPYPKPINLIIEKAYQGSLPYVEWEEEDGSYHLNFHRMEETKNQDTTNRIKVKRVTAGRESVHKIVVRDIFTKFYLIFIYFKYKITKCIISKIKLKVGSITYLSFQQSPQFPKAGKL